MKATYPAVILALSLVGCASPNTGGEQPLRPYSDSPEPIVDMVKLPAERLSAFQSDKRECRRLQERAMPISFLDAFGSSDVKAYERRREDQAAGIMRACLSGRGFQVLN